MFKHTFSVIISSFFLLFSLTCFAAGPAIGGGNNVIVFHQAGKHSDDFLSEKRTSEGAAILTLDDLSVEDTVYLKNLLEESLLRKINPISNDLKVEPSDHGEH